MTCKVPEAGQWCDFSIPSDLRDEAHEAEGELREKGITFDTGSGFGMRDWSLDWSVSEGHTAREIVEWVREHHPRLFEAAESDCHDQYSVEDDTFGEPIKK